MVKKIQKKNVSNLETIWNDPEHPAGFGGLSKLAHASGTSKKVSLNWLRGQLAYTLNKPMRRKFPTRNYKTGGINDLWQLDLMEMIPYASINDGNKYILTCIDVFSRYAYAIPLKSKSAIDVSFALKSLFKKIKPRNMQTDLGKEFYNSSVKSLLKLHGINHYSVYSQFKAALVERFNRTLRERISKLFTLQGNKKWVKSLPKIITSYNNSKHRSLNGLKPNEVNKENEMNIWSDNNKDIIVKKNLAKYKIDDYVRISKVKGPFLKNFDENWSEEVFQISSINYKDIPIMYHVKDHKGEIILGKFYHEELQVIDKPIVYRIQTILKTKGKGEHKQYYVKWHGYNEPSWINATDLV